MYFGITYDLEDGLFALSGPSPEDTRGWRLRYARSLEATQKVLADLKNSSNVRNWGHFIPLLEDRIEKRPAALSQLLDVDYQGDGIHWLHRFLFKCNAFRSKKEVDGILALHAQTAGLVFQAPPNERCGFCIWYDGGPATARILFSRTQGLEILEREVPQAPKPAKTLIQTRINESSLPQTSPFEAFTFQGIAADVLYAKLMDPANSRPTN